MPKRCTPDERWVTYYLGILDPSEAPSLRSESDLNEALCMPEQGPRYG